MLGRYDEALADLKKASWYDPKNTDILQLMEKAQSKVDEIVAKAMEKEKVPETGTVRLPGEPAKADPPPTPEPPQTPAPISIRAERPVLSAPAVPPASEPMKPKLPSPATAVSSAAALHTRGRQALQDGKFADAVTLLTKALQADPAEQLLVPQPPSLLRKHELH